MEPILYCEEVPPVKTSDTPSLTSRHLVLLVTFVGITWAYNLQYGRQMV